MPGKPGAKSTSTWIGFASKPNRQAPEQKASKTSKQLND
jgi:hypothetical protein